MRVADEHLAEINTQGYTLVPGFLADDELEAAQACLWDEFPRRDKMAWPDQAQHPGFVTPYRTED